MTVKMIFGFFLHSWNDFFKDMYFLNVLYVNKSVLLFIIDILLLQAIVDISGRKPVSE